MIKFFRTLRQSLLSEGKTGKPAYQFGRYLKYAIGEIVLVVIGILIALQINNWNELKKINKSIADHLVILKLNLLEDKTQLETLYSAMIDNYNYTDSLMLQLKTVIL